jgi:hypothetical protein
MVITELHRANHCLKFSENLPEALCLTGKGHNVSVLHQSKHRRNILRIRGSVPHLVYGGNSSSCADNFYFPRLLTCRENHRDALN